MLQHAVTSDYSHQFSAGNVVQADCGLVFPFRDRAFDAVVSFSAIQWLCVHPQAEDVSALFMREIKRCLKIPSDVVAQVYVHNDRHIDVLVNAARAQQRFAFAVMCIDFPHPTKAKKFFLCLHKGTEIDETRKLEIENRIYCSCILCWPYCSTGVTCSLLWMEFKHLLQSSPATHRLHDEHLQYSRRLLRLLRRAAWNDIFVRGRHELKNGITVHTHVRCPQLQPCGGPIAVDICFLDTMSHQINNGRIESLISIFCPHDGSFLLHPCAVTQGHQSFKMSEHIRDPSWVDTLSGQQRLSSCQTYFSLEALVQEIIITGRNVGGGDCDNGTTTQGDTARYSSDGRHYASARLTGEKIPPLCIIAMDTMLNDTTFLDQGKPTSSWSLQHPGTSMMMDSLSQQLRKHRGTIPCIDICVSQQMCSVAYGVYFANDATRHDRESLKHVSHDIITHIS